MRLHFTTRAAVAATAILSASLATTALPAHAAELLSDGGFEKPAVTERTARDKGGDPSNGNKGPTWMAFLFTQSETNITPDSADKSASHFTTGLTNETAHSGKQSFFVEYNKAAEASLGAMLQTRLIPIMSGKPYRASIWGKLDEMNPILRGAGKRMVYMKLQVDFFSQNGTQAVGNSEYNIQSIPGTVGRPTFFSTDKWREFVTPFRTPDDAGFVRLTWQWETGSENGETNGVAYFDDASLTGPAAPDPNATPAALKKRSISPEEAAVMDATETPPPGAKTKGESSPLPYLEMPSPTASSQKK